VGHHIMPGPGVAFRIQTEQASNTSLPMELSADEKVYHVIAVVLLLISALFGMQQAFFELLQFFGNGTSYFTDIGNLNLFDLAQIGLQFTITYWFLLREYYVFQGDLMSAIEVSGEMWNMTDRDEPALGILASFATILTFARFMSVMRGSSGFSYLLTMLRTIVADMLTFTFVLFLFLLVCTNALVILTSVNHPDFTDGTNVVFSAYIIPLLSVFERPFYDKRLFLALIIIGFTLVANIVMLNMLIAIMSESYNRVRDRMQDRQLLERAMLVLEEQDQKIVLERLFESIENFFSKMLGRGTISSDRAKARRNESEWFPNWLHVLVKRTYDNDDDDDDDDTPTTGGGGGSSSASIAADPDQPTRNVRRIGKRPVSGRTGAGSQQMKMMQMQLKTMQKLLVEKIAESQQKTQKEVLKEVDRLMKAQQAQQAKPRELSPGKTQPVLVKNESS